MTKDARGEGAFAGFSDLVSAIFKKRERASAVTIETLPASLNGIKGRHAEAEHLVSELQGLAEAAWDEAMVRLREFHDRAIQAAELKRLPDAAFAAEVASAERQMVRSTCEQALSKLHRLRNSVSGRGDLEITEGIDEACGVLQNLLAALPS